MASVRRAAPTSGYGSFINTLGGAGGLADPTVVATLNKRRQQESDAAQAAVNQGKSIAGMPGVSATPYSGGTSYQLPMQVATAPHSGDMMNTNPLLAGILAQRESEAQMATSKLRQFGYDSLGRPGANVLGAGGSIFVPKLMGV